MKQGICALGGLRYQLKMIGIQISSPSYIDEDNMSVVHNTSRLESVLMKKATQFIIIKSINQLQWESPLSDIT